MIFFKFSSKLSSCDPVKESRLTMRIWIFFTLTALCIAKQERDDKSTYRLPLSVFPYLMAIPKVRSSYGPLAYFSDIFLSGKNIVIYSER